MNIDSGSLVLGGIEGVKRQLSNFSPDRFWALAQDALKYPGGLDLLAGLHINSCVSPTVRGDGTYQVHLMTAVIPAGYQSRYWQATASLPVIYQSWNEAKEAACNYSLETKLPLMYEAGHFCKAPDYVFATEADIKVSMQSDIYPVTSEGRRIKFASSSNRKLKGLFLGEPDRVGWKPPLRRHDEWEIIHLWRIGEERRSDERIVKDVTIRIERLNKTLRFDGWCDVKQDKVCFHLTMVLEEHRLTGEFVRSEYQSFEMNFEQAAMVLPVVEAALAEVETKPNPYKLSSHAN